MPKKTSDEIEERDSRIPKKRRSHLTKNNEQNHTATLASFDLEILNFQILNRPFGMEHKVYVNPGALDFKTNTDSGNGTKITNVLKTDYLYKFGAKEWQDELGLNMYDYGWRNYDAAIARWVVVDPLAEKFSPISPYSYVANNPLSFYDPDGKDIYHLDKKTGEITLVEENDDKTDQIVNAKRNRKTGEYEVRRNNKGEIRKGSVKVDNIEKGILKDGINFQENSYVLEVGGENQPSEDGVENFVLGLSNYIDKEIQGGSLSKMGEDNVSYVFIGRYKNNTAIKAGFGINLSAANRPDLKINKNVNPKKTLAYPLIQI